MSGPIIIVDDDEYQLQFFDGLLRRSGYEPLGFTNAYSALELMHRITPSLIVIDLLMTPMNGFELSGQIHMLPHLVNIPVVMMSAQADFLVFHGSASRQISAFLAKPIRQHDALDVIDSMLTNSRQADHPVAAQLVYEL